MTLRLSALVVLCAISTTSVAAQQGLEDKVKNLAPGEALAIKLNPMRATQDMPAVSAMADMVVEATVLNQTSSADGGRDVVRTTYLLNVDSVLIDRRPASTTPATAVSSITVSAPGGHIVVDGHEVYVTDSTLPTLETGAHLILFLKRSLVGRSFAIVGGPYGVFREDDGHIRMSPTVASKVKGTYDGLDLLAFKKLVLSTAQK